MPDKQPFGIRYIKFVDILGTVFCAFMGILLAMISISSFVKAAEGAGGIVYGIGLSVAALLSFSLAMIPGVLLIWLARGIGRGSKTAKIWQIVFSGFSILLFPIGTILHGVAFYFLFVDKKTIAAFNPSTQTGQTGDSYPKGERQ